MSAYDQLVTRFHRLASLQEAAAVLHWDMAAVMPTGGGAARSEQLATLARLSHDQLTDPAIPELIGQAQDAAQDLDGWQRANLAEMERQFHHAAAVPADMVEALARANRKAEALWREARPKGDFATVKPALEEVLALVREEAAAKGEALSLAPYDALMDQFEPGLRTARLDPIFDDMAGFLATFLDQAVARQAKDPPPIRPKGPFAIDDQEALGRRLMTAIGFDFDHGRLDVSAHPFCGGVPEDVRITTRYDPADVMKALMGVLHETGHALYERGLPADWRRQPVGEARGMALHESQSLLIEMQVCRGPAFLSFLSPLLAETFGDDASWAAENLVRLSTRVEPGFIRVDADEVTYPAHIILRYRLERAMIAGTLAVADLPTAWNEEMDHLLGITPPDHSLGCLQDIHWFDGAWGYFPTYSLGAMAAAQFYAAASEAILDLDEDIGRGNFAPLMAWLREKVHGFASRYTTDELLERVTGRPLDPSVFKAHLQNRYLG